MTSLGPLGGVVSAALAALTFVGCVSEGEKAPRPNILWIIAEDLGPELGSYGHPGASAWTPKPWRQSSSGWRR